MITKVNRSENLRLFFTEATVPVVTSQFRLAPHRLHKPCSNESKNLSGDDPLLGLRQGKSNSHYSAIFPSRKKTEQFNTKSSDQDCWKNMACRQGVHSERGHRLHLSFLFLTCFLFLILHSPFTIETSKTYCQSAMTSPAFHRKMMRAR